MFSRVKKKRVRDKKNKDLDPFFEQNGLPNPYNYQGGFLAWLRQLTN